MSSTVLTFQGAVTKSITSALDGAGDVAVSPDAQFVYVAAYNKDAVTAWSRAASGDLTLIGTYQGTSAGGAIPNMDAPRGVAVAADGAHVYVACGNSDSIVVFSRDAGSGLLTHVQSLVDKTNLDGCRQLLITADGQWVISVASFSNTVAVFNRDPGTGVITLANAYEDGVRGPYNLTISFDQVFIYVGSSGNDRILVYRFNSSDGSLSLVQTVANGDPGISGLDSVRGMAIAPEDDFLYAVGRQADTIVVFSRGGDGILAPVAVYTDSGSGGTIPNLNNPQYVIVSKEGAFVMVTAYVSDSLSVFSRDEATGELVLEQQFKDGVGGVNGLNGALGLMESSDQKSVYVAGQNDDAVAIFGGPA